MRGFGRSRPGYPNKILDAFGLDQHYRKILLKRAKRLIIFFFTLVSVSVGDKDLKSAREAPESLGVKLTGTDGEKERKQQFWFRLGLLLQSWKERGREAPDLTCDERSEV